MINPYKESTQTHKEQVTQMFDNIAHRYDFLNHLLSMGTDRLWRKRAIKLLVPLKPTYMLDVATGTGDFAIEATNFLKAKVIGIDISEEMLRLGREKISSRHLIDQILLETGDGEKIKYENDTFDAVTVGFGIRNFDSIKKGVKEMHRVLKPGGMMVILELSRMDIFPVKQFFELYFHFLVPLLGRIFSKDPSAYNYLPESVKDFPKRKEIASIMNDAGFKNSGFKRLSLGIATLFYGIK